jgi:hypothetical protein
LLEEKNFAEIVKIVPETTLAYSQEKFSGYRRQLSALVDTYDKNIFTLGDNMAENETSGIITYKRIFDRFNLIKYSVVFRSKRDGWFGNLLRLLFLLRDGRSIEESNGGTYFRSFLKGYIWRQTCYDCKYGHHYRQGDLSIGDLWSIVKYKPELDDKKGTSFVLVNSDKGRELIETLRPQIKLLEEVPMTVVGKRRGTGKKQTIPELIRKTFFDNLDDKGFLKALKLAEDTVKVVPQKTINPPPPLDFQKLGGRRT